MGRFADFFKEQRIVLDGQKRQKMIALDREFVELESKMKILDAENLKLRADVNPLKKEIERLQNQVKETGSHGRLDELAEKILLALANGEHDREPIFTKLNIPKIKGDYFYDVLRDREFIEDKFMMTMVTPSGRAYLVKHDLIQ